MPELEKSPDASTSLRVEPLDKCALPARPSRVGLDIDPRIERVSSREEGGSVRATVGSVAGLPFAVEAENPKGALFATHGPISDIRVSEPRFSEECGLDIEVALVARSGKTYHRFAVSFGADGSPMNVRMLEVNGAKPEDSQYDVAIDDDR